LVLDIWDFRSGHEPWVSRGINAEDAEDRFSSFGNYFSGGHEASNAHGVTDDAERHRVRKGWRRRDWRRILSRRNRRRTPE
jgi:hypothetical protein